MNKKNKTKNNAQLSTLNSQLPKGWKIKKLGEACEIFNGLWKGKKEPFVEVGVIRNTNFTKDGSLDESDIAYLPVEVKQYEKRKLQFGDIILEKSGGGPKQPVGRVIVFEKKNGEYSFSNFTSTIRIKDVTNLSYKYLHRFLFWQHLSGVTETMQRRSTGIRNLQLKEYKTIQIPIPPLSEQKRIVAILDKAFAAIDKAKANAEQNLKNAKELFESYSNNLYQNLLLNNKKDILGNLAKLVRGPFGGSLKKNMFVDEGYAVYEQRNAIGDFTDNFRYFIDKSKFKEMERFSVDKGDILMSCSGTIGKFTIIPENYIEGIINQALLKITPNQDRIINQYLLFILHNFIKDGSSHSKGAAIKNIIAVKELKKIEIPLLNIPEQKGIVAQLDALQAETKKLESIYQQKIDNLEEMKKSILQKAFNGEL